MTPVAGGNLDLMQDFGGILGYPTTLTVGPDGTILKKIIDNSPEKYNEITKLIQPYL